MTLEELLTLVLDHRQRGLHTSMPGRVESYDAASQTCEVLPQLKIQRPDGEGGYTACDLPVLPSVPVCFPRGGGFFVSFPIQKGDFVMVVFSERAIGNWRQKGEASNPGDLRMHSLAGAVAIPGVYPRDEALDDADGTDMLLGKDGTSGAQIKITSSEVQIGAGATKKAARGGDTLTASANLTTWANAVETALNTATSPILPASSWGTLTNAAAGQLGSINAGSCSSVVKVKD